MSARICAGTVVLLLAVFAPRAFGHAERAATEPKVGARLNAAPEVVSVSYTEPPAGNPEFKVMDGCGNDVVEDLKVQNMTIEATLAAGQPGNWEVEWQVVSGVDGHDTRDSYSFKVAGTKDCNVAAPHDDSEGIDLVEPSGPGAGVLIPVALGAVALIGLALFLRGRSE